MPELPPEVQDVLRTARSQLRDLLFDWPIRELSEDPKETIGEISRLLGEKYDIETGDVVED